MQAWLGKRIYYGWVVVGVTALTLLVASGVRAASGVLIKPLESDLGWSRSSISFAISVGLLLYGLAGPLAGALMDRFGPRRLMLVGLMLTTLAIARHGGHVRALAVHDLLWGVLGGLRHGHRRRSCSARRSRTAGSSSGAGWSIGIFGAATSAGQLIFVPLLIWIVGVQSAGAARSILLAASRGSLLVPVALLMRDAPADSACARSAGPTSRAAPQMPLEPARRHARRGARAGVLAAGRQLLHLRRDLDRADRHPLHRRTRPTTASRK